MQSTLQPSLYRKALVRQMNACKKSSTEEMTTETGAKKTNI